jgi:hypothetical protein
MGCADIGCSNGVTLNFAPAFTAAGSYKFTVETDIGTTICQVKLPFDGCSDTPSCEASDVQLMQSGCALGSADQSLPGLLFQSEKLSQIHLTVERDGQTIHENRLPVSYKVVQPSGGLCGPTCHQSTITDTTSP